MSPSTAPTHPAVMPALQDCWRTIGVRGDRSCEKLQTHGHCRNCPVHAGAARTLLERDAPDGYLRERTAEIAATPSRPDSGTRPMLVFRVASEWFGLPAHVVLEVCPPGPIHALPHRRHGPLLGVVNVRGELRPCVSIGRMFGTAEEAPQSADRWRQRLVVFHVGEVRAACVVDEVDDVHRFPSAVVASAPATLTKSQTYLSTTVASWLNRAVGLIEERLFEQALQRALR